jgi:hypothetical protein
VLAELAVAAVFASALAPGAPAAGAEDERTAWAKARERWAVQDARDYTYRVRIACFCPDRRFVKIRVRAGKPRGTPRSLRAFDTVEELFARIDEQLRRGGGAQARYAARTGHPRSFSADPMPEAIDDEYGVTVRDLRITRRG